jgi:transcriptional regulator with XRE-family HTH domain
VLERQITTKGMKQMNDVQEKVELRAMFAKNLHRLMARNGMQKSKLATAAKMGIKTISAILNGETVPSPEQIKLLSDALKVDVDEFYK